MKVTNNSRAPQGVRTETGVVYVKPGEARDVALSDAGLKQAKRLAFLTVGGGKVDKRTDHDDTKSAADVLAMADGNFMAFKSAASKLLGDKTPDKKAEIVAALEDLATRP